MSAAVDLFHILESTGHRMDETSKGPVSCPVKHVAGVTEPGWIRLCRRIENGMATRRDASHVEAVGMLAQAIRIRQGLATRNDAVLVHLAVQGIFHAELMQRLQLLPAGDRP